MKPRVTVYAVSKESQSSELGMWGIKLMMGKHHKYFKGHLNTTESTNELLNNLFISLKQPCSLEVFIHSKSAKEVIGSRDFDLSSKQHDIQWYYLGEDSMPTAEMMKYINS